MAGTGDRITISNQEPQSISVSNSQTLSTAVKNSYVIQGGGTPYSGSYEVTPTNEEQTVETHGMSLSQDIVVHAIPSNYGLITWDGTKIIVS